MDWLGRAYDASKQALFVARRSAATEDVWGIGSATTKFGKLAQQALSRASSCADRVMDKPLGYLAAWLAAGSALSVCVALSGGDFQSPICILFQIICIAVMTVCYSVWFQ